MSPFHPSRYIVQDGIVYKRNLHQQQVRFVRGPHAGAQGFLLRKNGKNQHVMLSDGKTVVADLISLMEV